MEAELVHVLNALACERVHKLELIVNLIHAEIKAGMNSSNAIDLLALFNEHLESITQDAALSEDDVYPPMVRHRLGAVLRNADDIRSSLWIYIDDDKENA